MSQRLFDEIAAERDAMISRARRGAERDDGKTHANWIASLLKIVGPNYEPRHMWIKVAAVALRAVEAIDRRNARVSDEPDHEHPIIGSGGARRPRETR